MSQLSLGGAARSPPRCGSWPTGRAADDVARRLAAKDPTLWGPDAEPEASIRLGWLDLPYDLPGAAPPARRAARGSCPPRASTASCSAGMGGSSLAPEVICRTAGVALTVLDTTDPQQVGAALGDRLERTVVVVSSKSGGTVETDSHRRAAWAAFAAAGSEAEIGRHFVAVTDPGLAAGGGRQGGRLPRGVPRRPQRRRPLQRAVRVRAGARRRWPASTCGRCWTTPRRCGRAGRRRAQPGARPRLPLGAAWTAGRDKVVIADAGSGIVGFGDWAEQLIAESTGKQGKGLLPVVVEGLTPGRHRPATTSPWCCSARPAPGRCRTRSPRSAAPLGAQFLGWEYATAVAGWALKINPFDQPNVQESKDNTGRILESGPAAPEPAFVEARWRCYATAELLGRREDAAGALPALLAAVPDRGYLAVMAYLDRLRDASAADVRGELAGGSARPVTFGWAPRFLHSTGQHHKGGPQIGAFLQVTGTPAATSRSPAGPSPSASCRPRRRSGTCAPSPSATGRSCGSTSPTGGRAWPRCWTRSPRGS